MANNNALKLFRSSFIKLRTLFQLPFPVLAFLVALKILCLNLRTRLDTTFQLTSSQLLAPISCLVAKTLSFTLHKSPSRNWIFMNKLSGSWLPLGRIYWFYVSGYAVVLSRCLSTWHRLLSPESFTLLTLGFPYGQLGKKIDHFLQSKTSGLTTFIR